MMCTASLNMSLQSQNPANLHLCLFLLYPPTFGAGGLIGLNICFFRTAQSCFWDFSCIVSALSFRGKNTGEVHKVLVFV